MTELTYPFVEAFLREQSGTLYVLTDPQLRLRDALAVVCLSRFFAEREVKIRLNPMPAGHRRLFDHSDISGAFPPGTEARSGVDALLGDSSRPLEERLKDLFARTEEAFWARSSGDVSQPLEPRGPVLVLGRPSLYPSAFAEQVSRELERSGDQCGLYARFHLSPDTADEKAYRAIQDVYSGIEIPYEPWPAPTETPSAEGAPRPGYVDFAVIRVVEGQFRFRTFLFLYGTSTLGTLAAAQAVVDPDLNQVFVRGGVRRFFDRHGCAEILLRAERRTPGAFSWTREFDPWEIQVAAQPLSPVAKEVGDWVRWFNEAVPGEERDSLYRSEVPCSPEERLFRVIGFHPGVDRDDGTPLPHASRLVGGRRTGEIVEQLTRLAQTPEPAAIFIVGPTGVGKELAARIAFEARALRLIGGLGGPGVRSRPVTPGARWVAVNCANLSTQMVESQLFGIAAMTATGVRGDLGAILMGGEGVVVLDELESMPLEQQAKLLRASQPPYAVSPLGLHRDLVSHALMVMIANEEPETLVAEGRMRPDLFARLQPCLVRIPPLRERPGDIPALLAWVAGEPVSFDERVLRCLLVDDHRYNARGLFQIVARARERQHLGREGGRGLSIALTDLSDAVNNAMVQLFRELEHKTSGGSTVFRFEPRPPYPFLTAVFEEAAGVLSSIEVWREGPGAGRHHLVVRDFAKEYEGAVIPVQELKAQKERDLRIPVQSPSPEELGARWLRLVEQADRPQEAAAPHADQALRLMAGLFQKRFPSKGQKDEAGRRWAARAYDPARVSQKTFAQSLGLGEPGFLDLLRRAERPVAGSGVAPRNAKHRPREDRGGKRRKSS